VHDVSRDDGAVLLLAQLQRIRRAAKPVHCLHEGCGGSSKSSEGADPREVRCRRDRKARYEWKNLCTLQACQAAL
jgi:hypothetical protein